MIRIKGSICKEEWEKMWNSIVWDQPKREGGKHFKMFTGTIDNGIPDSALNDCVFTWDLPREDWKDKSKKPVEFLKARTLAMWNSFWKQKKEFDENNASPIRHTTNNDIKNIM